ncbi:MAG: PRD domain-containing protein, partial [Coprobacillus cateniformis]
LSELDQYMEGSMTKEEMEEFRKNIVKNFSLSNIMSNLTILNPNKLLEHIADAIDRLQNAMNLKLSNHTCFGLYVHISCLIERLVMNKGIELYQDIQEFEQREQKFISLVKQTFKEVEDFYGVDIPIAEIGYIYDYIKNDHEF